jgi:hypothetical protein
MDVVYKTDSDEHLINIGAKSEPQWCELTEFEIQEDVNAMNDYLDQQHLDDSGWDGE